MSFSLLGLLIIFVLGALIILTSLVMEPLAVFIQRHFKMDMYPELEWRTMQKLQLQRLAYDELGYGQWSIGFGGVPITMKGENLPMLDALGLEKGRFKRHIETQDRGQLVEQGSIDS
jgi:hypothetical protein